MDREEVRRLVREFDQARDQVMELIGEYMQYASSKGRLGDLWNRQMLELHNVRGLSLLNPGKTREFEKSYLNLRDRADKEFQTNMEKWELVKQAVEKFLAEFGEEKA